MIRFTIAALLVAGTGPYASASTINLGVAKTDGSVEAKAQFKDQTDNYLGGVNGSVVTAYSAARNPVSFGKQGTLNPETSVHAYSEADTLKGGYVGADFYSSALSQSSLGYRFEIAGPIDTQVRVDVALVGSVAITGDFSSTGGGANAEVWLSLFGKDVNVQKDVYLQNQTYYTGSAYSGFDASGSYIFDTNTEYDVYIRAATTAVALVNSGFDTKSNWYATADVDPTFTLAQAYRDNFQILYSAGIGTDAGVPSPVPLPASAPMFGAAILGLAGLGYASKRKKAAAAG